MKCVNCQRDYERLKKYGFFIGQKVSQDYDGNTTYEMQTTPIMDHVCSLCIVNYRKKFSKKILLYTILELIIIIMIISMNFLEYNGWKIFFIVIALLVCLPILFNIIGFLDWQDIGDQVFINNYRYYNPKERKLKYMTRQVFHKSNFKSNPVFKFLYGGIVDEDDYFAAQHASLEGFCANGCSQVSENNDEIYCEKCGWVKEKIID
jgi:hypothetical protein